MFRRRPAAPVTGATATVSPPAVSAAQLDEAGWVLPKGISAAHEGRPPAWTLVGTVGSPTATPVDPAGLVVGQGWSLDWWIRGDERWHLPAREPVRQDLIADRPLVETRLRIPGGDAVHRAFGIRSARGTGDEWVVVELENETPVPLAVALVVRPLMADGLGSVGTITIEPVAGGRGPDQAHLVRIDGAPALVLPRRPSQVAAGNRADGDAAALVLEGGAGTDLLSAECPDGLATLAFVFPVPHTAVLRSLIPVGPVDPGEAIAYAAVVPEAETVAAGWEIHTRGPRFEIPERRLHVAVERARTQILLAHDGEAVRRDGAHEPDIDPGATEVLLHAFDLLDKPADVVGVVARWQERLADASPAFDAIALTTLASHWQLHRDDALLDWMLPEVAAAVERLDRAGRKGLLDQPADRRRARVALAGAAELLVRSGQAAAGAKVTALAARLDDVSIPPVTGPVDVLATVAAGVRSGEAEALPFLAEVLAAASPTGAWAGPGRHGRGIGHDIAAAAAIIDTARQLLVTDGADGLVLLPVFPDGWYGAGVELHDAPTAFGVLSFAIRWHGLRPALLWDLVPHPDLGPVTITIPGLDATWSTTERRGDALLAEVTPPEGIDLVREVAEHPGLQEHMRPEAEEPEDPKPDLPDAGTFS